MSVVLLAVAAVILGGTVVVALGRGGELAGFAADRPPFDPDLATAADVALLRPPWALWGYSVQATDEAFNRIAQAVTERDVEIATLRRQLEEMTSEKTAQGRVMGHFPAPSQPPSGQPPSGQFSAGQFSAGQFSTGQFSTGQFSPGPFSASQPSAAQLPKGQGSTEGWAGGFRPAAGPRPEEEGWPAYPGSGGGLGQASSLPEEEPWPTSSRTADGPAPAGDPGPAGRPGSASGTGPAGRSGQAGGPGAAGGLGAGPAGGAAPGGERLGGSPRPSAFSSGQVVSPAPGEQRDSWSAWERPSASRAGRQQAPVESESTTEPDLGSDPGPAPDSQESGDDQ